MKYLTHRNKQQHCYCYQVNNLFTNRKKENQSVELRVIWNIFRHREWVYQHYHINLAPQHVYQHMICYESMFMGQNILFMFIQNLAYFSVTLNMFISVKLLSPCSPCWRATEDMRFCRTLLMETAKILNNPRKKHKNTVVTRLSPPFSSLRSIPLRGVSAHFVGYSVALLCQTYSLFCKKTVPWPVYYRWCRVESYWTL